MVMIVDELFLVTLQQVITDELEDANDSDETLDQIVERIIERTREALEESE